MTALALTLAVAFGLGLLATRAHLPPLLGFLLAGFALKASGAAPPAGLDTIADLGVTLLLFSIGLKIKPATLLRREVWVTASAHILLSVVLAGGVLLGLAAVGIGMLTSVSIGTIALVAFALSFSSTVLVVKLLEERSQGQSLFGRIAIGILVMQDIAAVAFITASRGEPPSVWALALVLLIPGAWLLHRVLDRISHGELLVVFGVMCALVPGYVLFESVGLKGDLGALVLGVILGRHTRSTELAQGMWSVKNLMLVGFFVSIGFSIEGAISSDHVLLALVMLALVPVQAVGYLVLLRWRGLRTRTATLTSLALANHSEFALIVTAVGVQAGLLDQQWLVVMALAVSFSFVASTLVNHRAPTIARWAVARLPDRPAEMLLEEDRPIDIGSANAIVLGMGRVGRSAYVRLQNEYALHPVGVEIDADRAATVRDLGLNAIQADATDPDFWERCQQHPDVRLVVLAMPFHGSNIAALRALREMGFTGTVAAISRFDDERDHVLDSGANVAFQVYDGAGASLADHAADAAGLQPPHRPGHE